MKGISTTNVKELSKIKQNSSKKKNCADKRNGFTHRQETLAHQKSRFHWFLAQNHVLVATL